MNGIARGSTNRASTMNAELNVFNAYPMDIKWELIFYELWIHHITYYIDPNINKKTSI